jgi:polyhydroxyalkanoate synthesis regulator phasin
MGLKNLLRAGLALDVVEAAKEAGRQLVENGEIGAETVKTVCRELMPVETYLEVANRGIQRALDKH